MTVYLVGAGPGDPGLLTVRARELIDAADVILYDRLIPPGVLDGVRAELVYVGKQGGGPQMPQEEIDRLLVQYGTGGRTVVRLKGGDPFVFGRGGEEALVLRAAGIPYEVVPGITAGIAAPAYAGVPVTHRELASGVAFVTGHENPAKPETALDWPALAAFPGTLVFYMGVKALPRIASQLIAGGRSPSEPVAVVERGTLPGQKTVLSTLSEVGSIEGIRAPAITLVGPVAALREQIAWLETRPLYGRTVAVTRARAQASALAARLRALGAEVVEAPAIRARALDVDLPEVKSYDLLCVTSPTGAEHLFRHLRDARELAGVTVAAIGPGTARALRERGVEADIVPERAVAEGLVEALDAAPPAHRRRPPRRHRPPRRRRPCLAGAFPFARVLVARAKRGSRRAARRAARARLARRRRRALRDGPRAARRRRPRGGRGRRLRALHLGQLRALLRRRGRRAAPDRGSRRSVRRPVQSCARTASSPTSRPTRTRPTASSPRCSPTP